MMMNFLLLGQKAARQDASLGGRDAHPTREKFPLRGHIEKLEPF
jgi:hypothetical protein